MKKISTLDIASIQGGFSFQNEAGKAAKDVGLGLAICYGITQFSVANHKIELSLTGCLKIVAALVAYRVVKSSVKYYVETSA